MSLNITAMTHVPTVAIAFALATTVISLASQAPAPPRPPANVVQAKAEAMAAAGEFAGALLVAHNGNVLSRQAYGLADREQKLRATPETKFRLGSMNKMFTAVAILQLVDAGRIRLDDTVAQHLPDYPNRDLAARVTLRHLLTHTGGTGDIFPEYVSRREELREHRDFLKVFGARELTHEPGAEERYSNYGFVLLGAVIERVTGGSYYDHVHARIFEPAGMRHTDSPVGTKSIAGHAVGYVDREGTWVSNIDTLPWRGTAAGGGYSTVDDLFRFATALQDGRLLTPATLALATTPHRQGSAFGLGFQIGGSGATRAIGHSGGAPGMNGELRMFPSTGHIFVALANQGANAASVLRREFGNALAAGVPPRS